MSTRTFIRSCNSVHFLSGSCLLFWTPELCFGSSGMHVRSFAVRAVHIIKVSNQRCNCRARFGYKSFDQRPRERRRINCFEDHQDPKWGRSPFAQHRAGIARRPWIMITVKRCSRSRSQLHPSYSAVHSSGSSTVCISLFLCNARVNICPQRLKWLQIHLKVVCVID